MRCGEGFHEGPWISWHFSGFHDIWNLPTWQYPSEQGRILITASSFWHPAIGRRRLVKKWNLRNSAACYRVIHRVLERRKLNTSHSDALRAEPINLSPPVTNNDRKAADRSYKGDEDVPSLNPSSVLRNLTFPSPCLLYVIIVYTRTTTQTSHHDALYYYLVCHLFMGCRAPLYETMSKNITNYMYVYITWETI